MSVLLIQQADIYGPEHKGVNDIAVVGDIVQKIGADIPLGHLQTLDNRVRVIDGKGLIAIPGLIDHHVHFLGAGGEGGPMFRTPPMELSDFARCGITTALGLLGTDGVTRSVKALFSKAKALEAEGLTTRIYTCSYLHAEPTITGDVINDLCFIDNIIGVKMLVGDHRGMHVSLDKIRELVSSARFGGIMSGKPGIIQVHVGDEPGGLRLLLESIKGTDIPIGQFMPTHLNRSAKVFSEALEFAGLGGNIDFTTSISPQNGMKQAINASLAVKDALAAGAPLKRITMSSDGNGSLNRFDSKGNFLGMQRARASTLFSELIELIKTEGLPLTDAIRIVSTNSADILNLEGKGRIEEEGAADILLLDRDSLELKYTIAKGEICLEDGLIVKKGVFED